MTFQSTYLPLEEEYNEALKEERANQLLCCIHEVQTLKKGTF